jgi:hypothetical protein
MLKSNEKVRDLFHEFVSWADEEGGFYELIVYHGIDKAYGFEEIEGFVELRDKCYELDMTFKKFMAKNQLDLEFGLPKPNCSCYSCSGEFYNGDEA